MFSLPLLENKDYAEMNFFQTSFRLLKVSQVPNQCFVSSDSFLLQYSKQRLGS